MAPTDLRDFVTAGSGPVTALLRADCADELRALDILVPERFFSRCRPTRYRGRVGPLRLEAAPGGSAIVRRCRRAGVAGGLLGRFHVGVTRSFREAAVSETARASGVATPEVLAAVDVARFGVLHSGFIVTREIAGAVPLRERLSEGTGKAALIRSVPEAIRGLHDSGVAHHDLTTDNILLDAGDRVWIVDLDGCRAGGSVVRRRRLSDLMRFRRSVHKNGLVQAAGEWGMFFAAYAGADREMLGEKDRWLASFERRLPLYRLGWRLGI